MSLLIIIFGILIVVAGTTILIKPETIFYILRDNSNKPGLQALAVVTRVILGLLLIYYSGESRYPAVIEFIGWLSLIAGIVLAVIGRRNFTRLMSWALSLAKPYGRVGGVLATAFGAFLIYAFT